MKVTFDTPTYFRVTLFTLFRRQLVLIKPTYYKQERKPKNTTMMKSLMIAMKKLVWILIAYFIFFLTSNRYELAS